MGFIFNVSTQQSATPQLYKIRAKVLHQPSNELSKIEGLIYSVKDSSLVIYNSRIIHKSILDQQIDPANLVEIPYNNFKYIKIQNDKNKLIGFAIGAVSGLIGGYFLWEGLSQESQAIGTVFTGVMFGAIGIGLGSIDIKVNIRYDIDRFNHNKEKLKKYSILK